MNVTSFTRIAFATFAMMGLAACSNGSGTIKGNKLALTTQNGKTFASLVTQLNTGNVVVSAADLPILNPQNPAQELGRINVSTPAVGQTDITLSLNLTDTLHAPSGDKALTLPNGTAFPIVTVDANNWISIKAGAGDSRLYLNIDLAKNTAVVGYALNADALSAGVPANIFASFAVGTSNDVAGMGGIYSGTVKGQSGLAVFADFSGLIGKASLPMSSFSKSGDGNQTPVMNKLYELNSKGARIRIR
jgi:hypothetical protein